MVIFLAVVYFFLYFNENSLLHWINTTTGFVLAFNIHKREHLVLVLL